MDQDQTLEEQATPLPGLPLVESPGFENTIAQQPWSDEEKRIAGDLCRDGFAVLRFPDEDFGQRADRCIAGLSEKIDFERWQQRGDGQRITRSWVDNEDARAIATNKSVIALLSKLYGREAFAFQTLNFAFGSQQHFHSDSVHFSSIPERFMCGVWVALEDVGPEQGPLEYYPGSHRWPILYNDLIGFRTTVENERAYQDQYHDAWSQMIAHTGTQPQRFFPKKGDALIWAANLLHGGTRHTDRAQTRWSQVTHYYFKGCAYTTPMRSDPQMGNLYLREITDLTTGEIVPNIYLGERAETVRERFGVRNRPDFRDFDPERYLALNPDLNNGINPYKHFLLHGMREGRRYR